MDAYSQFLKTRLDFESRNLAAATCDEARAMISRRLQVIKQAIAEDRAKRSEYGVPRPCGCLR